ncbi:hypothetical protein MMPV_005751 [Pyropia vietnamensis]
MAAALAPAVDTVMPSSLAAAALDEQDTRGNAHSGAPPAGAAVGSPAAAVAAAGSAAVRSAAAVPRYPPSLPFDGDGAATHETGRPPIPHATLTSLPADLLRLIAARLAGSGSDSALLYLATYGALCRATAAVVADAAAGDLVLPLVPTASATPAARAAAAPLCCTPPLPPLMPRGTTGNDPLAVQPCRVAREGAGGCVPPPPLRVMHGPSPAPGSLLGAQRVDRAALYWEVSLEAFAGHRLLVGVAPAAALRHGHLEVAAAYLFDCHGRLVGGGGNRRPAAVYGRKFSAGDRLGVLYHPTDRTLTFFDNGVSMGVAFRGVGAPVGWEGASSTALYPLLHLPGLPGEAVAFVPLSDLRIGGSDDGDGGARLVDVPRGAAAIAATARRWVRRPHPRDGQLCVTTAAEAVTYWLPVGDPSRTTVGALKARLAHLSGHALVQEAMTLASAGVRFVDGQCATDLMLYVPHLVS